MCYRVYSLTMCYRVYSLNNVLQSVQSHYVFAGTLLIYFCFIKSVTDIKWMTEGS